MLYLPAETLPTDISLAATDKDLVQRLEATVIHWTRQIKEVVSNQDNTSASGDAGGPIDEIDFWSSRTLDLSGISQQLSAPGLLTIVSVLRDAGSSYLGPFELLSKHIQQGSEEANDNLRFLSILRPHCEALAVASVKDIPGILPEILSRVRVIGAVSRYYHVEERLTGLLRKISNEVIKRCIAHININDVFDGDLPAVMRVLQDCLHTCAEWRRCYNATVDAVARNPGKRGLLWNFDAMSIFAQVEAFMQRCRDLQDVCEAQIQFLRKSGPSGTRVALPIFGGARGLDITRSLQTIEEAFEGYLAILRDISGEILDVKAVRWHDANNIFKSGVKELEVMMANVINDAFNGITSIPACVDLLEAFSSLVTRPAVQRAVDKKAVDVFTLFLRQLADVKTYFELHSLNPPLLPHEARLSGAALWAKAIGYRVDKDWQLLSKALIYLTPSKAAADAAEQVEKLQTSIEEYMRQRYAQWMAEIVDLDPTKVADRLATPLLSRCNSPVGTGDEPSATSASATSTSSAMKQQSSGRRGGKGGGSKTQYLRSNFDRQLLSLLEEVHGWEKFEGKFLIPFYAADLLHSNGEPLRILRRYVLLLCNDYNAIVSSWHPDGVEARLFSDMLRRLDRKIAPGLNKVLWTSKNVKDFYVKDVRKCCAEVWAVVQAFKNDCSFVHRLVDGMRNTLLVDIERNYVHEEGVFEDRQSKHRAKCRNTLKSLHAQMVEAMSRMYQIFKAVSGMAVVVVVVVNVLLCNG